MKTIRCYTAEISWNKQTLLGPAPPITALRCQRAASWFRAAQPATAGSLPESTVSNRTITKTTHSRWGGGLTQVEPPLYLLAGRICHNDRSASSEAEEPDLPKLY